MAANLQAISFVIILLLIVPGCINSQEMSATGEEMEQETELPEKLNLIADTAGRDIDRGQQMDLLADADGEKTLILWVATGCSGCHDWTGMIADSMREGNISNDTRIISIHRYPSFESREQVIDVYASENSSTQSLWPVLIPDEGQSAIDMDTGQNTDYSYSTAFDSPVTPSFTLIDGDGKTLWRSKVYWANQTLLTEAMDLLDS
ncbi:MAG: hypothetical protein ACKVHN_02530 [Candidatus Poseidoniales archaeon]|jgi:hypothetical protein